MGKMTKILRLLTLFCVLIFTSNAAYSAGYTCDGIKQYTACNDGFYPSQCDNSPAKRNGETVSAVTGGTCKACPSGHTCSGSNLNCPKVSSVTVTYNLNGGTGTTPSSKSCTSGSSCSLQSGATTSFYRAGYVFNGWSTSSTATSGSTSLTFSANTTVYAVWTACAKGTYKPGSGTQASASCSSCPTGYTTSGTATTAKTSCYISCAAGTRVVTADATCTSPAGPWYSWAQTVYSGSTSYVLYCMNGFTSTGTAASNHDSMEDCTRTIQAGYGIPKTTVSARYIKFTSSGNTVNTDTHLCEIQAFANNVGSGTNLLSGKGGISGGSLTNATDGDWNCSKYSTGSTQIYDLGSIQEIGSIKFALYASDGRTYNNVQMYVSTDNSNWTQVLASTNIATQKKSTPSPDWVILNGYSACTGNTYNTSISGAYLQTSVNSAWTCKACSALTDTNGNTGGYPSIRNNNHSSTVWCSLMPVPAGKYISVAKGPQLACTAGSYCPGVPYVDYDGSNKANTIVACMKGAYTSTTGQSSCTACTGKTTTGTGQTSCNATCPNAANVATWNTATWSKTVSNTSTGATTQSISNLCSIKTCSSGYERTGSAGTESSYVCTGIRYPVTLSANGGTAGSTTSVTATYGSSMPTIATTALPRRAGYTFAGYYDAVSGGTQYYTSTGASARAWNKTSSATLYAHWTACGSGYYCSGAAYNSKAACSSIASGLFPNTNTTTATSASYCLTDTLAAGTYINVASSSSATKYTSCTSGYICPGGVYHYKTGVVGRGYCAKGAYASNNKCVLCHAGQTTSSPYATSCVTCQSQYGDAQGTVGIGSWATPKWSTSTTTGYTTSSNSTYGGITSISSVNVTNKCEISTCTAGYYLTPHSDDVYNCMDGNVSENDIAEMSEFYQLCYDDSFDATSAYWINTCSPCVAGTYKSGTNATQYCSLCSLGQTSGSAASSCSACSNNAHVSSWSNTTPNYSTSYQWNKLLTGVGAISNKCTISACATGYQRGGTASATAATSYNCNTPIVYTITLNHSGGTGTSPIYEKYGVGYSLTNFGTTVTSVTKPTKSGVTVTFNANSGSVSPTSRSTSYTFNGYYTATSGGTQRIDGNGKILASNTTFTSNTTIYAQWTCNGVTLPTPTRAGHVFNGWYTAASGGTKIGNAGASYCPTSATTIYAQWTACTACSAGTGANCSMSVVNNVCTYTTSCKDGYYAINNNGKYNPSCSACGDGYYCKSAVRTACPTADTGWTVSTDTSTSSSWSSCYEEMNFSGGIDASKPNDWCDNADLIRPAISASAYGDIDADRSSITTFEGSYIDKSNSKLWVCRMCADGTYSAGGSATSCSACSALTGVSVSGGTYTSVSPRNANTTCRYKAPNKTITGCSSVTTNTMSYSGTAWPATTYNVSASGGYVIANNGTANATCTQCSGAVFSAGGSATSCTPCPTQTDGWTRNTGTGWSAVTQCYETQTPANCASGTVKHHATSTTAWNTTPTLVTQLKSKAGYYASSTATSCTICPVGSYCPASATAATSCTTLGGGLYKNSVQGSSANTACYVTTTAGKYIAANTDTAQTTCPNGSFCTAKNIYWPNVGGTEACPKADSTTQRTTFPDEYYPYNSAGSAIKTTTPTVASIANQSWGNGWASKSNCLAYYSIKNAAATFSVESVAFNTTTGKYDVSGSMYYSSVNGGYYLNTKYSDTYCNTGTNRMLYKKAILCPAGSYCPGGTVPLCNTGTHNAEWGRYACATGSYQDATGQTVCKACAAGKTNTGTGNTAACTTACTTISNLSTWATTTWNSNNTVSNLCAVGNCAANSYKSGNTCPTCSSGTDSKYTKSAVGTTSVNSCYLVTDAGKYVATAKAGQATCPAGSYCVGGTTIYYGTGTTTGGSATCSSGTSSKYTLSAAGASKVGQCYLTLKTGQQVATAGAGASNCSAGRYCTSTSNIYYNADGGTTTYTGGQCVTGSYSAAGASSCTACQSGKTTSAAGQSSCNATCSNATNVGAWKTATWNTNNTMTNLCTIDNTSTSACTAAVKGAGAASASWTVSNNKCVYSGTCSAKYYNPTASGATISCAGCPTAYPNSASGNAYTSDAYCYLTLTAGQQVAIAGAGVSPCSAGRYCTSTSNIFKGTAGGTTSYTGTACQTGSYQDATGQTVCKACAAGKTNTGTGNTAACTTACSNNAGVNAWTTTTWSNGTVSNLCTVTNCSTNYYKNSNACSTCTSNNSKYTKSANANSTGLNACYLETTGGNYVATAGAGQVACPANSYCEGGTKVYVTTGVGATTGGITGCPSGYASPASASAKNQCTINCAAGSRVTTADATCTAITSGNVYMLAHTVKAGSASPAATSCPTNYTISGSTQADHDAKSDCKISCSAGYAVQTVDAACAIVTSGYQTGTHTVSAGSKTPTATDSTSPAVGTWYSCLTNYSATGTAATDHDARSDCKISCAAGTRIANVNATSCTTPSGNWYVGAHTVSAGGTSSVNSCLTNYTISGTAATNHDAASDCKISCNGGAYIAKANDTSCTNVGAGYWAGASTVSQGSAGSRTACASGLTTIGYGAGADEAADCGRILNVGSDKIYLRSTKKTTPSLNVKVGDTTYYGNMTSGALDGYLIIKDGNVTYRVHDDSK